MKNIFICLLVLSLFLSCKIRRYKEETFYNISYTIPVKWKEIKYISIDSDGKAYETSHLDTVRMELGKFNNSFDEVKFLATKEKYEWLKELNVEEGVIIMHDTLLDFQQATFLDNYYYYDTISNRTAKLMFPKQLGKGETAVGVYFDSIDKENYKFSIYSYDPKDEETIKELKKVFYSLKISNIGTYEDIWRGNDSSVSD